MQHYPEFTNNTILLNKIKEVLRSLHWHGWGICSVGANAV